MPEYRQSKSQKRSKSQSKSGGRRKKQTMRKLRRGRKSRKVMRGGAMYSSEDQLKTRFTNNESLANEIFNIYGVQKPQYTLLYNTILKESSTQTGINSGYIINQTEKGKLMSADLKALFNQ